MLPVCLNYAHQYYALRIRIISRYLGALKYTRNSKIERLAITVIKRNLLLKTYVNTLSLHSDKSYDFANASDTTTITTTT